MVDLVISAKENNTNDIFGTFRMSKSEKKARIKKGRFDMKLDLKGVATDNPSVLLIITFKKR